MPLCPFGHARYDMVGRDRRVTGVAQSHCFRYGSTPPTEGTEYAGRPTQHAGEATTHRCTPDTGVADALDFSWNPIRG